MRVVVVGAGYKGFYTAKALSLEQHDVVVVDESPDRLAHVDELLDVMTVQGCGAHSKTLEEAGAARADVLIAVTQSDEINILTCVLASKYGVARKIARVSNQEAFSDDAWLTPADVHIDVPIDPEALCALEFSRLLGVPTALHVSEFDGGGVRLISFPMRGGRGDVADRLCGLMRGDPGAELRFVVPDGRGFGEGKLNGGPPPWGEVFVVGSKDAVHAMLDRMRVEEGPPASVVVVGGGRMAVVLAELLASNASRVTLVAPDYLPAVDPRVDVVVGDCLDTRVLTDAGTPSSDAFIAVSEHDETDIMACVTAKKLGAARVLTALQKPEHLGIMSAIPIIDGVVSRHLTAVSHVLRAARGGQIESSSSLHRVGGEAIELVAGASSPITRHSLRRGRTPAGVVIGVVVTSEGVRAPRGDDRVHPGDHAIVFAPAESVARVQALFA